MADVAEEAHSHMDLLPGEFNRSAWIYNWRTFSKSDGAMVMNLEIDQVVRGGIFGSITVDPANDDLIAVMMMWHIARDFRGHGIKLLKRWIKLAREKGAVRLTMNHLLDLDSLRLEQLYLRMGMTPLEKTYILEF